MDTPTNHRAAFYAPFNASNVHSSGLRLETGPQIAGLPRSEPLLIYDSGRASLPIEGQGTVVAKVDEPTQLLFSFTNDSLMNNSNSKQGLYALVSEKEIEFATGIAGIGIDRFGESQWEKIKGVQMERLKEGRVAYLLPDKKTPEAYWFSIDKKNGVLLFGRGYVNKRQALYMAVLKKNDSNGVPEWVDKAHSFIDKLTSVEVLQVGGDQDRLQLIVQPLPVVDVLPPYIVSGKDITLDQLAANSATVPENLTPECQKLYHNVAGPNIALDTPDFPQFTAAIERSVNTPGLICWKLLESKASEFGKRDITSTYLRITIGSDLGDSPGPPYVLEIWPSGHASPIHDHGDSHAVIKVLHGSIVAYYFDSLDLPPRQLNVGASLKKGDITWISPEAYQVHQLSNENTDGSICCTIQCYLYGKTDKQHYEWFRYLADTDGDNKPDKQDDFKPNSDMRFIEFKEAIKKEWEQRWAGRIES